MTVSWTVHPDLAEAIEKARGRLTLSAFLRNCVAERLGYDGPLLPGGQDLIAENARLRAELEALRNGVQP